jgi:hypothetical protein
MVAAALHAAAATAKAAAGQAMDFEAITSRLVRAYPQWIMAREGNDLLWRDGTRMTIADARGPKTDAEAIAEADIKDMFRWSYPVATAVVPPPQGHDPGRARNVAFFEKIYGDCRRGEVRRNLVEVVWLERTAPQRLMVTRVNGVNEKLAAVSRELDRLAPRFKSFLSPAAGTYNCRPIAGTTNPSAHGYGIAIDIAVKRAHYWRWSKPEASGKRTWRNAIPPEIVSTFEKHGFIWGGRWHHYDTMHFEYRPELIARP